MASARALLRLPRTSALPIRRSFATTSSRLIQNAPKHANAGEHEKIQKEKPLNPHMTNSNSTIANEMPSIGADKPPPELLTSVDPAFVPKDAKPENTERMTGGTQESVEGSNSAAAQTNRDLGVGEIEGGSFRVEPLRRTGEDVNTMRARLVCKPATIYLEGAG